VLGPGVVVGLSAEEGPGEAEGRVAAGFGLGNPAAAAARGRGVAFGVGRAFNSDLAHARDLGGRRFLGGLCLDVGGGFLAQEHWA